MVADDIDSMGWSQKKMTKNPLFYDFICLSLV